MKANWPETEEDSLNVHHQEEPVSTQSSSLLSSDLNNPDTIDAAAQTHAGSLQQLAYDQSTTAAATRLAAPRSAAARRAYQAARASDLPWSDVEEVFDRKWHGGGRPTTPRPATAAECSSLGSAPADTTPRKR